MQRDFYKDALFNGMTANAFALGTVLHLGWFWQRVNGCCVLYRGSGIDNINFDNILEVADYDAQQIQPPSYLEHLPDSSYYYVLRKVSSSGDMELTFSASAKVDIDPNGKLAEPLPNAVFVIKADIIDDSKVRLSWFYCPLQQKSRPAYFNIYTDNGTGQVDYQNAIAKIKYQGRRFYTFISAQLQAGKHLFAVKAMDKSANEDVSQKTICVEITGNILSSIQFSSVEIL